MRRARADSSLALAAAAGAGSRCRAARLGARVPGQDRPRGERRAGHAARDHPAHLRRGGRAAVRDHLGHRRRRAGRRRPAPCTARPANPDTLVVPLRPHLPEGWYLIYWRAISVDGHPVQGAFTYAVGPNPGPAPQFRVPNISATATTPQLLIARWVMFVAVMVAIGLFVLRLLIARAAGRTRRRGRRFVPLSVAFVVAAVARADRDPGVPGLLDRQRLAALGVRPDRARAAVSGDRVRAGDRRPRALLCPVLPGGWDRAVGGSSRAGAALDRRAGRVGAARCWPRPRCWSCRARPGTRRRPRRAG